MKNRTIILFFLLLPFFSITISGCSGCHPLKSNHLSIVDPTNYLETGGEFWQLISFQDSPSGSQHVSVVKTKDDQGNTIYETTQETYLQAKRFYDTFSSNGIKMTVRQKPDGTLLGGQTVMQLGNQPVLSIFELKEDGRLFKHSSAIKENGDIDADPVSTEIECKPNPLGPFALNYSLWNQPMQQGEIRTIKNLDFLYEKTLTTELTAKEIEQTQYSGEQPYLLRIDAIIKDNGNIVANYTLWTDAKGNIIKVNHAGASKMELILSTKKKIDAALENQSEYNLNQHGLVATSGHIVNPAQTKKVQFRVQRVSKNQTHEDKKTNTLSLAETIPQTTFQTVTSVDHDTVDISVIGSSPTTLNALFGSVVPSSPEEKTTAADLACNEWVQSANKTVIQRAEQASSRKNPLWDIAVDIEKFMHENMRHVNYSNSFTPAGEVAQTLTGDSTEYAILMAAIARAKKIPSRVAVGLAYTNAQTHEGTMVFHAWTEMYIEGHWYSLDATQGLGGANASRIMLAHSNLADESLVPTLIAPIIFNLGNLHVTVLSSQ